MSGWFGMTIRRDIGASADGTGVATNWEASANFKFQSDDWFGTQPEQKQMGRMEFLIMDSNNDVLAGFIMRDSTTGYQYNIPEFYVGRQQVYTETPAIPPATTVKQYNSKTKKYETKTIQPVNVGKWNDLFGKIIIRKIGNQFYFELQKLVPVNPAFDEPSDPHRISQRVTKTWYDTAGIYDTKKAKTINIWYGKYRANPFIGLNYTDHVRFVKHNVSDYHDVPNLFNAGDKLVIDCSKSQVYLNNGLFMDKIDVGSVFPSLVEGETEIQLVHSSEGEQPTCITKIIEKFL
jgi:hypothetical protein